MRTRSICKFKQKKLIAKRVGDELLLYDEETSTGHCLNRIAGEMWVACKRESSVTEVTEALRPGWPDIEKEVVWASLSQMAEAGLLEDATDDSHISMSRRELIGKVGITAAAVLPIVVTSLLIPLPAAAASCGTLGSRCGAGRPCCSPLICVAGFCV